MLGPGNIMVNKTLWHHPVERTLLTPFPGNTAFLCGAEEWGVRHEGFQLNFASLD